MSNADSSGRKVVGSLFSPAQGNEDSRLTWLPHLLQRWYYFVQRGHHIGRRRFHLIQQGRHFG
jgi:hypothetical protein